MLKKYFFVFLDKFFNAGIVYAHCDIPCGIYNTESALTAAKTVKVMAQKIKDEDEKNIHNIARLTYMKEKHSQICKDELLILWSDFFKEEHLEKLPDLHSIIWSTVKLCSKNKRTTDIGEAEELINSVEKIDKMFNSVQ